MTDEHFSEQIRDLIRKAKAVAAFRRYVRAEMRAGRYLVDHKLPKAVKTFNVEKLPPAEMPAEPTLSDIARQLGVSLEELQQASGGMSLDRLMQLLGVETPAELIEQLQLIIGNQPKGLTRLQRVKVAVTKVRMSGRRVGQLMALEKAKAARAAALKKHRAVTKRR